MSNNNERTDAAIKMHEALNDLVHGQPIGGEATRAMKALERFVDERVRHHIQLLNGRPADEPAPHHGTTGERPAEPATVADVMGIEPGQLNNQQLEQLLNAHQPAGIDDGHVQQLLKQMQSAPQAELADLAAQVLAFVRAEPELLREPAEAAGHKLAELIADGQAPEPPPSITLAQVEDMAQHTGNQRRHFYISTRLRWQSREVIELAERLTDKGASWWVIKQPADVERISNGVNLGDSFTIEQHIDIARAAHDAAVRLHRLVDPLVPYKLPLEEVRLWAPDDIEAAHAWIEAAHAWAVAAHKCSSHVPAPPDVVERFLEPARFSRGDVVRVVDDAGFGLGIGTEHLVYGQVGDVVRLIGRDAEWSAERFELVVSAGDEPAHSQKLIELGFKEYTIKQRDGTTSKARVKIETSSSPADDWSPTISRTEAEAQSPPADELRERLTDEPDEPSLQFKRSDDSGSTKKVLSPPDDGISGACPICGAKPSSTSSGCLHTPEAQREHRNDAPRTGRDADDLQRRHGRGTMGDYE